MTSLLRGILVIFRLTVPSPDPDGALVSPEPPRDPTSHQSGYVGEGQEGHFTHIAAALLQCRPTFDVGVTHQAPPRPEATT
jgi:hypothetical protein